MFPKIIKLILAILTLIYSIYQFYLGEIGNGIFLTLLAGMFLLIYYKNEILIMAFLNLRKQNIKGTEKWLNKIKNPQSSLVKKQQGYYNYLFGMIYSQTNLTKAEKYFRAALKFGLNFNTDLAMTKLSLAGILMQKRRKREATLMLNEAKKLDKHNMLKEQISMIKQQMKKI